MKRLFSRKIEYILGNLKNVVRAHYFFFLVYQESRLYYIRFSWIIFGSPVKRRKCAYDFITAFRLACRS